MSSNKVSITAFMNDYVINYFHINPKVFLGHPEIFIKSNIDISEKYGFDSPPFSYDVYNIEAEALGRELRWLDGALPEINPSRRLLDNLDDFKKLKAPTPGKTGRMSFVSEVIRRCSDKGIKYTIRFCAPFTLACNIRGYEQLMIDIWENPGLVDSFFLFLTDDVLSPWIEYQRGILGRKDYALGADAMSSLPLASLKIIDQFSLKYILRLQENLGNLGTRAWRGESMLKDPRNLLDLKLKANPKFLDCVDPDVFNLGPEYFYRYAMEKNISLTFGIDPKLLTDGSPEEVSKRILNYMGRGCPAKGLTIHLMHIPVGTPEENITAAVETVRKFNDKEMIEKIT
jgi:uroporphyrinogen-III decarboxylase